VENKDENVPSTRVVSGILVLHFLLGCVKNSQIDGGISIATLQPGWYQVYFTDPVGSQAQSLRGGPDEALAEHIRAARLGVDIAMDSFNLWSLREALIAVHRKGIPVRVVVESDNLESSEVQDLVAAGIQVVEDNKSGLMHNKFAIIDRLEVWTGSMNLTLNGAYRSDNNLIRIRSPELAENYLVEFEEMFVDRQFGPGSPANTPLPNLNVEETQLEVYFSPEDGTIERLVELVGKAQEEILFLAYSFTDDDLAQAIITRAQAGVHIAGVLDESQAKGNIGGEYTHLLESGIEVRLDGNPRGMHHKVLIIDGRIVVTGSYNFSNNAKTRNDENTLILHNSEVAALFKEEFERVWTEGQD
jgi:phosphatidylserine/phosphatidylglycerophosphate/cardiolipin synthase-like enzyme